jgi:hypothetical protein
VLAWIKPVSELVGQWQTIVASCLAALQRIKEGWLCFGTTGVGGDNQFKNDEDILPVCFAA